jgi:quinoprotein glucose dehydrogenase
MTVITFRRRVTLVVAGLALILTLYSPILGSSPQQQRDWPAYGAGPADNRYSTLAQINRSNVSKLEMAWTYDSGETGGLESSPIIVGNVLYTNLPSNSVVALDAASGKVLWKFDPGTPGGQVPRSVTYWSDGKDSRILAGILSYVYELDAETGKLVPTFGKDGRVDLREGLGREPVESQSVHLSSPAIIYKDVFITGGRNPEGLPAPPGDIRAYDVRTGKLRWQFHTVPHPGEPGYETWPKDAWTYAGAANNWAGMAIDTKRGILYAPTGSPAGDYYGASRTGNDLYANCLLALNAETGKLIWYFQAVRHDLWDRDFPSPPTLLTVKHNGKMVDAVGQTTKSGWVYVFNRVTGESLFPIEYKKYPASTMPGEVSAEEQPLPTKPAPFARQLLTEDMLTKRTPEAHAWAEEKFKTFRSEGQFIPPSLGKDTVNFPGFDGGAEWGGSAADPQGILYVNANDLPWTFQEAENMAAGSSPTRTFYLSQCSSCHGDNMAGSPPDVPALIGVRTRHTAAEISNIVRNGQGRMPSFTSLSDTQLTSLVTFLLTELDSYPGAGAGGRSKRQEVRLKQVQAEHRLVLRQGLVGTRLRRILLTRCHTASQA